MDDKLDMFLYEQLKAKSEPDPELNRQILETCSKEERFMKTKKTYGMKKAVAAAMAVCIIGSGGVTGFAAYHYLNPAQVASEIGGAENALAKAFDSKDAVSVGDTQSSNGYDIRLLGLVSGTDLSPYVTTDMQQQLNDKKTYAALAISRTDGQSIGDENLCVSPLINGVDWKMANNGTLHTGLCSFQKDGILYELMECDDLEIFSDRGVQIGIVDAFGKEGEAFTMDEKTGVYQKTENYTGTNALFELPLDTKKADPDAADKQIQKMKQELVAGNSASTDEDGAIRGNTEVDDYIVEALKTADVNDFLTSHAKQLETQVLPISGDGTVTFTNAEGEKGTVDVTGLKVGEKAIQDVTSADSLESVRLGVYTLNDDNTVTYEVYMPDETMR